MQSLHENPLDSAVKLHLDLLIYTNTQIPNMEAKVLNKQVVESKSRISTRNASRILPPFSASTKSFHISCMRLFSGTFFLAIEGIEVKSGLNCERRFYLLLCELCVDGEGKRQQNLLLR